MDLGIDAIGNDQDVVLIRFAIAEMTNYHVANILDRNDIVVEPEVL